MKNILKEKAIKLRIEGLSYSEIRKQVKVSKSSLSLWLRSVGLTKQQKQRLTIKKLESIRCGWEKVRQIRIEKTQKIYQESQRDILKTRVDNKNLFLMGLMLYWAEGSKQKENIVSQGVIFSNSDPLMIVFFLKWVKKILEIKADKIVCEIYIHRNKMNEIGDVKKFWSKATGYSVEKFDKIYYKRHNVDTNRKKVGNNYFGLLRIRIKSSTDLNRKIAGWINALCNKWGVV